MIITFPTQNVWRRGQTDPLAVRRVELHCRMAQAIAWTDMLETIKEYRSNQIKPRFLHDGPDDLVCQVGASRARLLNWRKVPVALDAPIFTKGRFLVYFPDEDLCDGAAESASGGFFDVFNLPAFDTWVSFFVEDGRQQHSGRRYLLCYVPPTAVEAANKGVEVNPEMCIQWLDNSDVAIRPVVEAMVEHK